MHRCLQMTLTQVPALVSRSLQSRPLPRLYLSPTRWHPAQSDQPFPHLNGPKQLQSSADGISLANYHLFRIANDPQRATQQRQSKAILLMALQPQQLSFSTRCSELCCTDGQLRESNHGLLENWCVAWHGGCISWSSQQSIQASCTNNTNAALATG